MKNDTELKLQLKKIVKKLIVDTYADCKDDVVCSYGEGIMPRGPAYEAPGKPHGTGAVIVGINPGNAGEKEKLEIRNDPTREKFLRAWDSEVLRHPYHNRLRKLAWFLNLRGAIVWTELVKCESRIVVRRGHKHKVRLSVKTIRRDVNKYLFEELKFVPERWPLIGVGREVYKILSYTFPNRIVIGVPHATAAWGDSFHKLLRPDSPAMKAAKRSLCDALKKNDPVLISLFDKD